MDGPRNNGLSSYEKNMNISRSSVTIIKNNIEKDADSAVKVIYESPKTVILQGDLITPIERLLNPELWQAMDQLRDQYGFNIQHLITSGVGSEGNPTVVYILLTK